jgi:hypothetical protein
MDILGTPVGSGSYCPISNVQEYVKLCLTLADGHSLVDGRWHTMSKYRRIPQVRSRRSWGHQA